ncbi:MAG: hypothetical protein CL625_02985, partial [Arenimonas sp.]|nr:hypothetical protein [Arenimonas sp.]
MTTLRLLRSLPLAGLALALAACASMGGGPRELNLDADLDLRTYRDGDDLLTGGLGADGLRSATPPAFTDPSAPTPAELRRRAIWTNWRGIADLVILGDEGDIRTRAAELGVDLTAAQIISPFDPHYVEQF